MENINSYSYFLMDSILENIDYKWDYENGTETDYRNGIVKKLSDSYYKSKNKLKWYERLIQKISKMKVNIFGALMVFIIPMMLSNFSKEEIIETTENNIAKTELVDTVRTILKDTNAVNSMDVSKLSVDSKGIEAIKYEEKLKLNAYDIDDGMITIGYGHAEKKKHAKYKMGDEITEKEAEELLRGDLKEAEDGVKRMFKQWGDKGIKRELTQNQYNSMVSMAFNMGVGGLRRSKIARSIKKGDYDTAAEHIKTTRISKKHPGLEKRRMREYKMFISK